MVKMQIDIEQPTTDLLKSKSTRDGLIGGNPTPIPDCFIPTPSSYCVIGQPGSGKSFFAESFFKKFTKNCWDRVICCCAKNSQGSYKNSYMDSIKGENLFDKLTPETLAQMIALCEETKEEGEAEGEVYDSVIIFDDVSEMFRNKIVQHMLVKLLQSLRHERVTVLFLAQRYMSIPKPIRVLVNSLILFKGKNSLVEMERTRIEHLGNMTRDQQREFFDFIFDGPENKFSFLMTDRRRERLYKNFSRVHLKLNQN